MPVFVTVCPGARMSKARKVSSPVPPPPLFHPKGRGAAVARAPKTDRDFMAARPWDGRVVRLYYQELGFPHI